MTRRDRRTLALLPLVATLIATAGCTDRAGPTDPAARADVAALAQPSKPKGPAPKLKSVSLSTTQLVIDGPSATFTAVMQNNGDAKSGIWLKAEIVQGTTRAIAGGRYIACPDVGVLPPGGCTFTADASASSTAPGGSALVPGSANFVVTMYQVVNDVLNPLDSKSVPVTLGAAPAAPTISNLSVTPSTLVIDGLGGNWTATFQNAGAARTGVSVNGYVVQGTDTVPTGGSVVNCPPNATGTLPSGSCTMSYGASVSSSAPGGSLLVPGSATFLLAMFQTVGGVTSRIATATYAITLSGGSPTITSIVFTTTNIVIDPNQSTAYTLTIDNPGPALTGIYFQAEFHQGTAVRAAGGSNLVCGSNPEGTLPTGTCTMQFNATASNFAGGSGDLTEGPADFVLTLASGRSVLASKTVPVNLYLQQF